jgi:putative phosphoribosyl transferase
VTRATFRDRADAGRQLAERLRPFADDDVVVLALPRGGVPVAAEVADVLDAPFDVVVVRKLGVPVQPELAMGAVGEGPVGKSPVVVWNDEVLRAARVSDADADAVLALESAEVARRAAAWRGGAGARVSVRSRVAVLVDDGVATGSTMVAACRVVRAQGAGRVVVAVPVSARPTFARLRDEADDVVCVHTPQGFSSVGQWYDDFSQVRDEEVALTLASRARPSR